MKNKKLLTGISFLVLLVLATQFSMIGYADETAIVRDFDRDRDQYQDGTCEDPNENNYNSTISPPETSNGNDTCIPPGDGDQVRERDRIRDQLQDGTCNCTCICEQDGIKEQLQLQDGSC
jgi:hypothetical protein